MNDDARNTAQDQIGRVATGQPFPAEEYWDRACRELSDRDEILRDVIATYRDERLQGSGDPFRTLLNAITGQQISVTAAERIWSRLLEMLPGLTPGYVLQSGPEDLRAVGLSRRKTEYIRGIAEAFEAGTVDPDTWSDMDDGEIRDQLISLRGVGPWTAEMMLIFHLQRPDILPVGDLGLVNGASRLFGWEGDLDLKQRIELLRERAERWKPWRTVATWYIWRDLDAEPVVY